jgi:SAM-dependent methyltransferase
MTTQHHLGTNPSIRDFLDRHDPDLVLAALRDRQGGPAHMRRLGALARALVKSGAPVRRILDLRCGPGDLGRTLGLLEPGSEVDFVDPDPFSLAVCARINRRRRVRGRLIQSDPWDWDWADSLEPGYDVVAMADGLRHLDPERAAEVVSELASLLAPGGQLLLCEPTPRTSVDEENEPISRGDEWRAFFRRLERHLGPAGRRGLLTSVPPGRHPIDDAGLPLRDYLRFLRDAGFGHAEVLGKGDDHVSIRAVHAGWEQRAA